MLKYVILLSYLMPSGLVLAEGPPFERFNKILECEKTYSSFASGKYDVIHSKEISLVRSKRNNAGEKFFVMKDDKYYTVNLPKDIDLYKFRGHNFILTLDNEKYCLVVDFSALRADKVNLWKKMPTPECQKKDVESLTTRIANLEEKNQLAGAISDKIFEDLNRHISHAENEKIPYDERLKYIKNLQRWPVSKCMGADGHNLLAQIRSFRRHIDNAAILAETRTPASTVRSSPSLFLYSK